MSEITLLEDVDLMSGEVIGKTIDEGEDGLRVDSPSDANRLFGAIKGLERKLERLHREVTEMHEDIDDFYQPKIKRTTEQIDYLKSKIEGYVQDTGESLSTPYGRCYSRTDTTYQWGDVDEETLIAYARAHCPDAVQKKVWVNKNTIKDAADRDDFPVPTDEVTRMVTYITD